MRTLSSSSIDFRFWHNFKNTNNYNEVGKITKRGKKTRIKKFTESYNWVSVRRMWQSVIAGSVMQICSSLFWFPVVALTCSTSNIVFFIHEWRWRASHIHTFIVQTMYVTLLKRTFFIVLVNISAKPKMS